MKTFEQFQTESLSFGVVTLERTLLADTHTPVSIYLTLWEEGKASFLFESVEPDEKIGRYSFVGVDPFAMYRERDGGVEIRKGQSVEYRKGSMFDVLRESEKIFRQSPESTANGFTGGFVGFLGYGAVRHIERLPTPWPDPEGSGESAFGLFASIIRFDHQRQTLSIFHNIIVDLARPLGEQYAEGVKIIELMELRLRRTPVVTHNFRCETAALPDGADRPEFEEMVAKAKEYIVEGDIFQVVLSRRIRLAYEGNLFAVYRALRMVNPSPYLFFVDFGETKLVGSSPEVLVRVHQRTVEVLPIAGTRKRGKTDEEDRLLAEELLRDEKELAEHVMLVDLGRNDVGRVSEFGSVEVTSFKRIERYSHVMHIVSDVQGRLGEGKSALDALMSCFPAGTVSGAPKVRAMEIIHQLEGKERGIYAGAVGYLGFNGNLDTCIAIRTIVARGGVLSIQSGAGIVADSVAELEYVETQNKAAAMVQAVALAHNGLKID